MTQAASLGVLQVHLSGGEPTLRKDLEAIVCEAAAVGLYTNLITSAVSWSRERVLQLAALGLDHVQLSIQDTEPANADRLAHFKGGMARKREAARWVKEAGLALTIHAPIHRQNIARVPAMIAWAVECGAERVEIAHVQYYAWALRNRRALLPEREAFVLAAKSGKPRTTARFDLPSFRGAAVKGAASPCGLREPRAVFCFLVSDVPCDTRVQKS